ncbi:MAG TPA: class I SAM-dependent methyltransferase [Oligoflexia bacterium]|nr:class I SAM-dependent methyltransferase [Oligoflexia bacterium]HMP47617.1 class I SAM-dependent methyltransferase [Oligoflexia bacterium]
MAILCQRSGSFATENSIDRKLLESVNCLSCGSDSSMFFINAKDDLSGMPGLFTFVKCLDCNLVYQNPRITLDNIPDYYDDNYIAYRKRSDWGILSRFHKSSMYKHDLDKLKLISEFIKLDQSSKCLDLGCATGSFPALLNNKFSCESWGLDFKDFSTECRANNVSFIKGTVSEMPFMKECFDLITMWHFLEHDYDPLDTLKRSRQFLKKGGYVIIEVPALDSLSFKVFRSVWPGLQAPQHTALYSKSSLLNVATRAGLKVVKHLPYGAFPPFFYWYAGVVFIFNRGNGVNFRRHIPYYFLSQVLTKPLFYLFDRCNMAMQTIICRKDI